MIDVDRAEAQLRADAENAAGTDNWGDDDSFREGLRELLVDVDRMTGVPRDAAAAMITGLLTTRLRLESDALRAPGIVEQDLGTPIVVVGMPRTGTSLLFELLALDPESRSPLQWEADEPSPPPSLLNYDTDPRIARSQATLDAQQAICPELAELHPTGAQLPAECHLLTMLHFDSPYFMAFLEAPNYARWNLSHREFSLYRTHRRFLQQLQWEGPQGRWTLKSPPHLLSLDALLQAYPGARLVQTHRDPAIIMPSLASLITHVRSMLYPDCDPMVMGAEVVNEWITYLDRGIDSRAKNPVVEDAVFDLPYRELVNDPLGSVRSIYDYFALPFLLEHEKRIVAFLEAGAGTGHGSHQYSLAQFGIDEDRLKGRLATYYDRFADLI